jgi:hypothetical protein
MKWLKKIIKYYKYPKYAVFIGCKIDDRALFSLAKNLQKGTIASYAYSVELRHLGKWERPYDHEKLKSCLFIRIWTYKQLIQVARIFKEENKKYQANDYTCVRKSNFFDSFSIRA